MQKNKKRMNLLMLALSSTAIAGLFLMTGCGNGCGQVPRCGKAEYEGAKLSYKSIPMCGGCLTSGWGCSSCLWGENCILATVSYDQSEDDSFNVVDCSELYYGDSCLGCGYSPVYAYTGVVSGTTDGKGALACFLGSSDDSEYICGYYDGCACAAENEDNDFAYIGPLVESLTENSKKGTDLS